MSEVKRKEIHCLWWCGRCSGEKKVTSKLGLIKIQKHQMKASSCIVAENMFTIDKCCSQNLKRMASTPWFGWAEAVIESADEIHEDIPSPAGCQWSPKLIAADHPLLLLWQTNSSNENIFSRNCSWIGKLAFQKEQRFLLQPGEMQRLRWSK